MTVTQLRRLGPEPWGIRMRRARDVARLNVRDVEEILFPHISKSALIRLEQLPHIPAGRKDRGRAALVLLLYGINPEDLGISLDDLPPAIDRRAIERLRPPSTKWYSLLAADRVAASTHPGRPGRGTTGGSRAHMLRRPRLSHGDVCDTGPPSAEIGALLRLASCGGGWPGWPALPARRGRRRAGPGPAAGVAGHHRRPAAGVAAGVPVDACGCSAAGAPTRACWPATRPAAWAGSRSRAGSRGRCRATQLARLRLVLPDLEARVVVALMARQGLRCVEVARLGGRGLRTGAGGG